MSNLDDTIQMVRQIIHSDKPIVFPIEPEPEEPLLSEEDALLIAQIATANYLSNPTKKGNDE